MENIYSYYINLDRRTDRDIQVKKDILNLGFLENKIKRFSAVNGLDLINDLFNKNYINDQIIHNITNSNTNTTHRTCTLACLLSHYFLLKEISLDPTIPDDALIYIFEDDVFINEEYFKTKSFLDINKHLQDFSKLNQWDILYLGGRFEKNFISNTANNSFHQIDANLYFRTTGWGHEWCRGTFGYVVNKKSSNTICNIILENFNNQNVMREIDTLYDNSTLKFKTYDYFPHIFYSPVGYSTDIQHNYTCVESDVFKNFMK